MPDFSREREFLATRRGTGGGVAGVDEAGRGAWAGPLVAAAVVLRSDADGDPELANLDDSKQLSAPERDRLAHILHAGHQVAVCVIPAAEVDRLNVLGATMRAMTRAVRRLLPGPGFVLVDGNRLPPDLPCRGVAVVRGDGSVLTIAAASVIAKTVRDRLIMNLAVRYPGFGWERNKGYGTKEHIRALEKLGITPEHRKSFAPIRKILSLTPPKNSHI